MIDQSSNWDRAIPSFWLTRHEKPIGPMTYANPAQCASFVRESSAFRPWVRGFGSWLSYDNAEPYRLAEPRWGVEKNVELLGVQSFHRLFPGKKVRNDMVILNENT